MALSVLRAIFPDRVFGNLFTTTACLNAATGPIDSLTKATTLSTMSFSSDFESVSIKIEL